MDYRVRRTKADLDSAGFMEVGPGRYLGEHWQEGFLFIWEDAFIVAEGTLAKHLPSYDHFGMHDVPRSTGLRVTAEWRELAARLDKLRPKEAREALQLSEPWHEDLGAEIVQHRTEIARMSSQLAGACDHFLRSKSGYVFLVCDGRPWPHGSRGTAGAATEPPRPYPGIRSKRAPSSGIVDRRPKVATARQRPS